MFCEPHSIFPALSDAETNNCDVSHNFGSWTVVTRSLSDKAEQGRDLGVVRIVSLPAYTHWWTSCPMDSSPSSGWFTPSAQTVQALQWSAEVLGCTAHAVGDVARAAAG